MADQTTLTGNPSAQLELPGDLTGELIDLVRGIDLAALPGDVQRRARHSLADTVGVQALGSVTEPVQMLRRVVLNPQRDGATVIGPEPVRAGPLSAAMINGLAGHVRDFDDAGAGGHVSAIIVPVTLALADRRSGSRDSSGRRPDRQLRLDDQAAAHRQCRAGRDPGGPAGPGRIHRLRPGPGAQARLRPHAHAEGGRRGRAGTARPALGPGEQEQSVRVFLADLTTGS